MSPIGAADTGIDDLPIEQELSATIEYSHALVDPGVLSFAREDAVLEFAGKRGGRPSAVQRR